MNPFHFPRHFDVLASQEEELLQTIKNNESPAAEKLQEYMQSQFLSFQQSFEATLKTALQAQFQTPPESKRSSAQNRGRGKGKGRGKSTNTRSNSMAGSVESTTTSMLYANATAPPLVEQNAHERIIDYIRTINNSQKPLSEKTGNEDPPGPEPKKKRIYIKSIECCLNGVPIDQLEDTANADEALEAYFRMFYFNGQLNSLFTNGLSYDDFL